MTCQLVKKKRSWLALTIPVTGFYEDPVASFLVELTGTGVEFSEKGVTAYLPLDEGLSAKLRELNRFLRRLTGDNEDEQTLQWFSRIVYEEDWSESWKAYFRPMKIGKRIVIAPSWENYQPQGNEVLVNIDPGRAFGVGTHPTTYMCVKAIERFAERREEFGKEKWTLCDVGCGTGILAIVAAKLGADHVTAVDIDPAAVEVSIKNSTKNSVGDRVKVITGSVEKITGNFDCVVANLTTKLLLKLSTALRRIVKPGGSLILSGVLDSEMDEVDRIYRSYGMEMIERASENEWGLLECRAPGEC